MEGGLSIRDIARETGVSEGTLRMWETRYGFPDPERLPSGHRRYSDDDVAQVRQVARDREAGLSMKAAIDRARELASEPEVSIYAGLRRRLDQVGDQERRGPTQRNLSARVVMAHEAPLIVIAGRHADARVTPGNRDKQ